MNQNIRIPTAGFQRKTLLKQIYKQKVEDRIKIARNFLHYSVFILSIICLLNDWTRKIYFVCDHFFMVFVLFAHFLKIVNLYISRNPQTQNLWNILWESYDFHAMMFTLSIYIAYILPKLFVFEILLFSFRKTCKIIHHNIAPILGELSEDVRKFTITIYKSNVIRYIESILKFCFLPYLILFTVSFSSVRILMSLLVNMIIFAPYTYLHNKYHAKFWKTINFQLTQFAFDNTTKPEGKLALKAIDIVQTIIGMIANFYV